MYDLSPGITMRSTIPAYSYRHGLNFIPGIVKTRIDCYSGISNPWLIVMAQAGGFVRSFLSGRFCPGWFLSVPFLSEYIHYNRKLNIAFNYRFQVYEIFFKETSHTLR